LLLLGIETSCDETAIAVVKEGKTILSNVIASQISIHRPYNGVFPELASREHVHQLLPTLDQALKLAGLSLQQIDGIACAYGPGLLGSLIVGVEFAKHLAYCLDIPLIKVNHVEAHLYAAMMSTEDPIEFPSLGAILSGGHTHLLRINDFADYDLIGATCDDAIGEAFDKVAALLGLPYPGGPEIEQLARLGDPQRYAFKPGHVKSSPYDFSYSGLKTQVLYAVKGTSQKSQAPLIDDKDKKDVAASFQRVACYDAATKIVKAALDLGLKQIFLGGGVSNNCYLRQLLTQLAPPTLSVYFPKPSLTIDNGAMIAGLGFQLYRRLGGCLPQEVVAANRPPFLKQDS
jgi:N6-L-threonylcarbamoyladenine synthase